MLYRFVAAVAFFFGVAAFSRYSDGLARQFGLDWSSWRRG
jgi:hypothetical protein